MSLVVILPGPEDPGPGRSRPRSGAAAPRSSVVPGPVLEAAHWEHRVADGQSRTLVRLPDGTVLDDASVGAVLNRLPAPRFAASRTARAGPVVCRGRVGGPPPRLAERHGGAGHRMPDARRHQPRALRAGCRAPLAGVGSAVRAARAARPRGAHPVWLSVPPSSGPIERWTVVGHVLRSGVAVDEGAPAQALRSLAKIAGVDLLDVTLRSTAAGDELVGVDLRPALTPGSPRRWPGSSCRARARPARSRWRRDRPARSR